MPRDGELHKAAYKGDTAECEDLIENGADVNESGAQERTAIHRAIAGKHDKIVALLIEKGADCRKEDIAGRTPMHWAAIVGAVECARVLIEKGNAQDSLNILTKEGRSAPLHMAAEAGHASFCAYAVEQGADVTLKDSKGQTAYDLAKKEKKKDVMSIVKIKRSGRCSIM